MKLYSTMPIKINTWDTHVCCMVCKMYILNNPYVVSNRPWEAKFRACGWSTNRLGSDVFTNIHPVHDTRDGVKLTGLGFCRQYDANEVPNDEHARWDTMGNDWSSLRDLNGYAFHDRCWNLIMEHFSPWEFDFESLYEALECLPWPEGSASLSMSYQLSLETNHSLMYIAPWIHQIRNRHNREGCDPFILPTLEQLMQPSTSFPASPQGIAKGSLYHNPTDPFNVLPLELREGIAMQLPHAGRSQFALLFKSNGTNVFEQFFLGNEICHWRRTWIPSSPGKTVFSECAEWYWLEISLSLYLQNKVWTGLWFSHQDMGIFKMAKGRNPGQVLQNEHAAVLRRQGRAALPQYTLPRHAHRNCWHKTFTVWDDSLSGPHQWEYLHYRVGVLIQ